MIRGRSAISAVTSLACLGLVLCLSSSALAAAPISSNAIRVTPTLSNISLLPGETSTTIVATVTNLTSQPLRVGLNSRDFSASETQPGAIQLYGAGYNPNTDPHGLQTTISFASPAVLLAPNQTQKVAISLSNLSKLAPGGHYGAVLFSPEPTSANTNGINISIGSSVASLIFLSTPTGGTAPLRLLSFSLGLVHFKLPSTFNLTFQDTGNTQTWPEGQLTLFGPSGSIVSTTVLNPGEGLVLPGTVRLFETQLSLVGLRFARPGIYRLELQYRSRTATTFTTVSKRFLYLNLTDIIPPILFLILLVFVLIRYGASLLESIIWTLGRIFRKLPSALKRLLQWIRSRFTKKQPPPPEPPKPKRPRLIQG
jgi:hypothetical protein